MHYNINNQNNLTMSLSTLQLFTFLQLPKIGEKKILTLGEYALNKNLSLDTTNDLLLYINNCIDKKIISGIKEKFTVSDIISAETKAKRIFDKSENLGISIISIFDEIYPSNLRHIVDEKGKNNSPIFLHIKGDPLKLSHKYGIAVIGTREITPEGEQAGLLFSKMFAEANFNIISGLAIGCDTTAHKGALNANGLTTAFLAGGLDLPIYPKENTALAQEIIDRGGLLVSEYPVGDPILANKFVARDRLQSGLADATLVIQTGIKGGTMHAVNATIVNKKPLYAVQYKGSILQHEKVQGNIKLCNDNHAQPLTSKNIEDTIVKLKEEINSKKQKNIQGQEDSQKDIKSQTIIEQSLF